MAHDFDSLKAACDFSAPGARPQKAEPLPIKIPTELKDCVAGSNPNLLHHDLETDDGSISSHSHSSSLTSIHTEAFSPTQSHTVSNATLSSLGDESCQIFDQEMCNTSYASCLNLPHGSSFWPVGDITQMPSGHHSDFATTLFSPSNLNETTANDSNMSPSYKLSPLEPATSSSHSGSNTTSRNGAEAVISPSGNFVPASSYPPFQNGPNQQVKDEVRLGPKRMKKLDTLLEMLETALVPDVTEHNEIVNELRELCQAGSFHHRRVASNSFLTDPEEPTISSSAAKFAYDLLSWEKFRQEEKRLMREQYLSPISASKEVNARMIKARRRPSKTRDWASDGRKAAKMFFDALNNCDMVDRSFALLLLASNVSLDQMLKIAHFPALRSSFASRFARVVKKRAEEWSVMSGIGFSVLNISQLVDA